jgi:hypothetical protein
VVVRSVLWGAEAGLELGQVGGCGSAISSVQNRDDCQESLALGASVMRRGGCLSRESIMQWTSPFRALRRVW